jgi:hypothetical protein
MVADGTASSELIHGKMVKASQVDSDITPKHERFSSRPGTFSIWSAASIAAFDLLSFFLVSWTDRKKPIERAKGQRQRCRWAFFVGADQKQIESGDARRTPNRKPSSPSERLLVRIFLVGPRR